MPAISLSELIGLAFAVLATYQTVKSFLAWRHRSRVNTPLKGPERLSFLWGWSRAIVQSDNSAEIYEGWVKKYGSIISMPTVFWGRKVILTDPKAVTHFYAKETTTYVTSPLGKVFIQAMLGNGLLTAEGESHKRQRKALTPAFSIAAIRRLTDVFYDSTYKAKDRWDAILDSAGGEAIIEVQDWMNHISLDSIGIAGFGHEFGSLEGKISPVVEIFESFNTAKISFVSGIVFLLSSFHPIFSYIPTERNRLLWRFKETMSQTATELLSKTRQETKALGEYSSAAEKSIIGLLIKGENAEGAMKLSHEEVMAQMNVLLLAGYETTSISLTWALIELSKAQGKQEALRKELSQFSGTDPTYEQLMTSLPYLDAVTHEVLRVHPPLPETNRVAARDDVIPLSIPYTIPSGEVVDRISVAKGSMVSAPIAMINRSTDFWGPDAKEFKPERWLDNAVDGTDKELKASQFQGYRHLLTFSDGPRICLGKNFALAEFKAALSVLIRNYRFEFPGGPETEIAFHSSILKRPKVAGEQTASVPLRVRRAD